MSTDPISRPHTRLLVLLQAKNEERYLPDWLGQLEGWVDGVIALDDGSTDRTAEILEASPLVLEVLRNPPGQEWHERANQIALVQAGRRHSAEWLLCLDADERVEIEFARQAQTLLSQADVDGIQAYQFHLRDLWRDRDHYRVDGIWNNKHLTRLFKNVSTHKRFDLRPLHRFWLPLEIVSKLDSVGRHTHLNIYHLSMIEEQDRMSRVRKYEQLDPDLLFQPIGYRYLVDETNLTLEVIPEGRGYFQQLDVVGDPPV